MSRSDESLDRRQIDRDKLRQYLDINTGISISINVWYKDMEALGLGRSDRQRLSDLRKEGWVCDFNKKDKCYFIKGQVGDMQQQDLFVGVP